MKEYLLVGIISIIIVFILDTVFRTRLFFNKKFWIFQAIVVLLTTVVDNYSSGRPFVIFNEEVITGIRILHVPFENYLFGLSLLTLNLILYEYSLDNESNTSSKV